MILTSLVVTLMSTLAYSYTGKYDPTESKIESYYIDNKYKDKNYNDTIASQLSKYAGAALRSSSPQLLSLVDEAKGRVQGKGWECLNLHSFQMLAKVDHRFLVLILIQ